MDSHKHNIQQYVAEKMFYRLTYMDGNQKVSINNADVTYVFMYRGKSFYEVISQNCQKGLSLKCP